MGEIVFFSEDSEYSWPGDKESKLDVSMYNDLLVIMDENDHAVVITYKELEQIYLKAKQEGRI